MTYIETKDKNDVCFFVSFRLKDICWWCYKRTEGRGHDKMKQKGGQRYIFFIDTRIDSCRSVTSLKVISSCNEIIKIKSIVIEERRDHNKVSLYV